MAAGEDQLQTLVGELRVRQATLDVHRCPHSLHHFEEARLVRQGAVPPEAVDGAVPCRRHQPRPWVGGNTITGPALGRDGEGLLRRFLGEVEVAEEADGRGEHVAPLLAEDLVEQTYHSLMGRTSTA